MCFIRFCLFIVYVILLLSLPYQNAGLFQFPEDLLFYCSMMLIFVFIVLSLIILDVFAIIVLSPLLYLFLFTFDS